MNRTFAAVLFLGLAASPSLAAPNLIQNGSFEQYLKAPADWTLPDQYDADVPVGSNLIPDWAVINGNIDYFGPYWQAAQGTRSIDLAGSKFGLSAGGVSQSFATQAGKSYLVTFAMSGNPYTLPSIESSDPLKTLRVSAAGQSADFSYDVGQPVPGVGLRNSTPASMKYDAKQFIFTANSAQTTLQFISTMAPRASGAVIDDIEVHAVPEPSTAIFSVVGLGLLFLLAALRKSRLESQAFSRGA